MSERSRRRRPAANPAEREAQLITLAYDLVEQRLIEGTATSQETTTFIKMGSGREALERLRLENENLLMSAKREQMEALGRVEEKIDAAMDAMRRYSGNLTDEEMPYGPY
jgi:hypothetical protein